MFLCLLSFDEPSGKYENLISVYNILGTKQNIKILKTLKCAPRFKLKVFKKVFNIILIENY